MDILITDEISAEHKTRFEDYYEMVRYMESNGFTHYNHKPFNKPEAEPYYFQKRYKDGAGTKYFITAYVFLMPISYCEYRIQFETQLYQKNTHDAVNQIFIGWKLPQIEAWLDNLFVADLVEHYEFDKPRHSWRDDE